MKVFKTISGLLLSLTLLSCGQKESSTSSGGDSISGNSSCLAKYEKNIGDMLKKERLAALIDLAGIEPAQEVENGGLINYVQWTWPSDRIRNITIVGTEQEVPIANTVSVTNLKLLNKEKYGPKDAKSYVEQNYRTISGEEMKEIEANMQKAMQKALEEKVKKGELSADQAKMGEGVGGALMSKERIVETIENVGDACRWVAIDNLLAVGHGNVFFSVTVDISADTAVNRGKAIELAKMILSECE